MINIKLTLWQGNCLELMKQISDNSVDMVLCDLPYGVTRNEWDKKIPFDRLWEQYNRVVKDNGAVVLNCQQPFTSELIMSNKVNFKYCWTWYKRMCTGFLNSRKQPLRNCEDIAVFYRKQCTYNPLMRKGKFKSRVTGPVTSNYNSFVSLPRCSDEYYPTTLLEVPMPRFKDGHPTQKPVPLYEYLIKTYTNENETVLDNCMGSGTVSVARVNTNRNFIGIELNEEYYRIAEERICTSVKANEKETCSV